MSLKLGVPSKGRLMEKTFSWFEKRGIMLSRSGSDREYAGKVDGIDGVSLVLLSAGEIPRELAAGRIHLGVTGIDLVQEKLPRWEQQVEEISQLGFGKADLIIATRRLLGRCRHAGRSGCRGRGVSQDPWPPPAHCDQVSPAGA